VPRLFALGLGRRPRASERGCAGPAPEPAAGEPFPAFTARTKTRWADIIAALQEAEGDRIHAEDGEIDPHLACLATALSHSRRGEKLALAVSFESARPRRARQLMRQSLRRERLAIARQMFA
jgi:DNA-binding IclR family transcriptional regulator